MDIVPHGLPQWRGWEDVTYAKDQPQYRPLHTRTSTGPRGEVISRWRLTWAERLRVLLCGDLWLTVLTFGNTCPRCGHHSGLQPVLLATDPPKVEVAKEY